MIFKLKESKLGMTLVEMVISLVILSILMTSTMGMIMSSNNIFISTSQASLDKRVGNGVFDLLEKVLRYSTHMTIYDADKASSGTSSQSISLSITDNDTNSGTILYKGKTDENPINLYDPSFYNRRTVQYSIKAAGTDHKSIKLIVKVYRDGELHYTRESVVKCVNLNLVAFGDGANPLTDKSSDGAVNQFITFSVDEQLISGGKNAYSLEYKISEYMAKYNRIQNEYTAEVRQAYALINNDYQTGNPKGLKGSDDKDGSRILKSSYATTMANFNKIVFGDGASITKLDKDDINNCVNLRDYFQAQILDLLKFKPTAAGFNENEAFYGVVATREELYTGFMLTYYDENNDGVISKSEYPQFENSDEFFAGTSMANYLKNTSNNQMVIMSYFKENSNGNYTSLVSKKGNFWVHTSDGITQWIVTPEVGTSNWKTDKQIVSKFDKGDTTADSYTGIGKRGFSIRKVQNVNEYYWYNIIDDGKAVDFATYEFEGESHEVGVWPNKKTITHDHNYRKNSTVELELVTALKATDLTTVTKALSKYSDGYKADTVLAYAATVNLPEGWYYVHEGDWGLFTGSQWGTHFIYLEANKDNDPEVNTAVGNIAVKAGENVVLYSSNYTIVKTANSKFRYQQCTYRISDSGVIEHFQIDELDLKAHQYTDYVLYGADWNSWFVASPSGLINKLITGTMTILNRILGRDVNKDVTSISGANAVQSLGNHGQFTINSISTEVASYNTAWVVYSPKRGTWYYMPSGSTRISNITSGLSISSKKDQPVALDVAIGNGKTWSSSTEMINDIDSRKLSKSGLFGLVDTTKDVMWVALPTGNTINRDEVV